MNRAHRLLPRLLLASAIALSALGAAPVLSEPAPAPAQRALPDPLHPCTVLLCLPKTGTAVQSTTPAGHPVPCAATTAGPLKVASDPEEGGQIARTTATKPKVGDMTVTKKADSASTKMMEQSAPASTCP